MHVLDFFVSVHLRRRVYPAFFNARAMDSVGPNVSDSPKAFLRARKTDLAVML